MKVIYEVKDLGRGKWCGDVVSQSEQKEHIEHALMRIAREHLMSHDIDFSGDRYKGWFIVGGMRVVGEYRRKGTIL